MMEVDLLACLVLNELPGIGPVKAKQIIEYIGKPSNIFELKNYKELPFKFVDAGVIKLMNDKNIRKQAEKEIHFLRKSGIEVLFYGNNNYPSRLQHCMDAPLLLFFKGNAQLENNKSIAIVGTRKSTNYGKYLTEKIIEEIKVYNPLIVSGLAYGIDKHAHQFALDKGLQTLGVLAHGLDIIYPKDHYDMAKKMLNQGGIISEFFTGAKPERENFPKRNRIIAGLVDAVIVVEAQEKGGALITADIASSYHREIFTFPGNVNSSFSVGCNELIKYQKAQMICGGDDVAFFMNWKKEKMNPQMQLNLNLSNVQKNILEKIEYTGTGMDHLSMDLEGSLSILANILLELELMGLIEKLPGKIFRRK